jgi:hypothetical protein
MVSVTAWACDKPGAAHLRTYLTIWITPGMILVKGFPYNLLLGLIVRSGKLIL